MQIAWFTVVDLLQPRLQAGKTVHFLIYIQQVGGAYFFLHICSSIRSVGTGQVEGMPGECLMVTIDFAPIPKIACVVLAPT